MGMDTSNNAHFRPRMDLVDPEAILAIGQVLADNVEKHGERNWDDLPVNDLINHAIRHLYLHLAGDSTEHHLAHAATRLMMALGNHVRRPLEGG